ncbi:MAG TPA: putative sugar nucleotidyl transferase [Candidatus Cloacimonadota bacterium]|nr:putative sugar nucleotidyl transferase [Candidatus Cloacimonadota bacterium]
MLTIIFDDHKCKSFYPICLTRSVGDLRCGILKLRQRLEHLFSDREQDSAVIIESRLVPLYQERHPDWAINQPTQDQALYLNSRLVVTHESIEVISKLQPNEAYCSENEIAAMYATGDPRSGIDHNPRFRVIPEKAKLYNNLAEVIHDNSRLIRWDFDNIFYDADNAFDTEPGVTVLHPYNVWIGENVQISPGVVIDASEGPVVIDNGARVMSNAVLTGPLYLGKNSLVKIGAKLYGGVSIGPVCKVGGEIEGSILQAYSNKQHDGFLGHAYIGEWVNLGADTNNSDLKNTYKNVHIYDYLSSTQQDSGSQFMGCIIGDHSKTGINVSLNTGTVVGVGCNIFSSNLFSGFIPDFSWGEAGQLTHYRYLAFCETAALVKQRRNLAFSGIEADLYKTISGE